MNSITNTINSGLKINGNKANHRGWGGKSVKKRKKEKKIVEPLGVLLGIPTRLDDFLNLAPPRMMVNHARLGKKIRLSQPQQFLAQGRDIIEEAYPGDIIGLIDPGIFLIGDTLCEEGLFQYEKLPQNPVFSFCN